jgi:hypothetical protein
MGIPLGSWKDPWHHGCLGLLPLKIIENGSQLVFWSWKLENDEDLKLV